MFKSYRDIIIPSGPPSKDVEPVTFYKCGFCKEGWNSETELLLHKRTHASYLYKLVQEKKPVCLICLKLLKSRQGLIRHTKLKHLLSSENAKRIEREVFICDICDGICFNKKMLEFHMVHYHEWNRKGICPVCSVHTVVQASHIHFKAFRCAGFCPICLKDFQSQNNVVKHAQSHRKYFYCDMCQNHLANASNFNIHLEQHKKQAAEANGTESDNSSSSTCNNKSDNFKRFFIPRRLRNIYEHEYRWKGYARGLLLRNVLSICVLCREICDTEEEMRSHVSSHCVVEPSTTQTVPNCACGEWFSDKILLKQHTLKCAFLKKGTETIVF